MDESLGQIGDCLRNGSILSRVCVVASSIEEISLMSYSSGIDEGTDEGADEGAGTDTDEATDEGDFVFGLSDSIGVRHEAKTSCSQRLSHKGLLGDLGCVHT
jgi:hypothetical protein